MRLQNDILFAGCVLRDLSVCSFEVALERGLPAPAYDEKNKHDRCNAKQKRQNQSRPWTTHA